jgi:hypothetical protein
MTNYWVVGAMWSGHEDQAELFCRRGYWWLGWTDQEQPTQAALRDQIKPGDRIAIKKMIGKASPNVMIRAIGVVKEVDKDDKRVYVHWAATDLNREVPSRGCFASIHGPFAHDDPWTQVVFQL